MENNIVKKYEQVVVPIDLGLPSKMWQGKRNWTFFVHPSVTLDQLENIIDVEWEESTKLYDQQIKDKIYEMRLVTCPIEYKVLIKKFIKIHKLQNAISQIEEMPGISLTGEFIKVVTFHQVPNRWHLTEQFLKYMHLTESYQHLNNFYMISAFPWFQPRELKHFEIPVDTDRLNLIFPIVLDHLATMPDSGEQLNIFDLLTVRLAFCDFRNPLRTHHLNSKLVYFIRRALKPIVKHNHFDVDQLIVDCNFDTFNDRRGLLIHYLLYEFQNYFGTVKFETNWEKINGQDYELFQAPTRVKLIEQQDILGTVDEKFNIDFIIDGMDFKQMTSRLFLQLLPCRNIKEFIFDTNYAWSYNGGYTHDNIFSNELREISIHLCGDNRFNFIEGFVETLNKASSYGRVWRDLNLHVYCKLNCYLSFSNVRGSFNSLTFRHIEIDTCMLEALTKCNFKASVNLAFDDCSFQSNSVNWRLLTNLMGLSHARIREDEYIWHGLFEFILTEIADLKVKEFKFNRDIAITFMKDSKSIKFIHLSNMAFIIDAINSKLELNYEGCPVDLYYLKNNMSLDELDAVKTDFEFYQ